MAASPIREGDRIFVRLPPSQLRLFDAAGMAVRKRDREPTGRAEGASLSRGPSDRDRRRGADPAAGAGAAGALSADGLRRRRRLLDTDGRPFLVQGDTAWSLIANLDYADAIRYLDDRRAKGFNAIIVN
jgi:hypothetical protein